MWTNRKLDRPKNIEGQGVNLLLKPASTRLTRPGKNQESWALDLELEDLKLLCPDGTEANLDEFGRCHLAAVPANAVVVRMEDKCRVWKYLERLQVGAKHGRHRRCVSCVVMSVLLISTSQSASIC